MVQESLGPALKDGNTKCSVAQKNRDKRMKQLHISKTKTGHRLIPGPAEHHISHRDETQPHASPRPIPKSLSVRREPSLQSFRPAAVTRLSAWGHTVLPDVSSVVSLALFLLFRLLSGVVCILLLFILPSHSTSKISGISCHFIWKMINT